MKKAVVLSTVIVIFVVAGSAYYLHRNIFTAPQPEDVPGMRTGIQFEVQRGSTLRGIAEQLERQGIIPSAQALVVYARIRSLDSGIQAGVYLFDGTQRPVDVLDDLRNGNTLDLSVRITVPEGFTKQQIARRLAAAGILPEDEFLAAAEMSPAYADFPFLAELENGTSLEGFLFPETYRFIPGSSAEDVVRRMLSIFMQRTGEELLAKIDGQERSLRDVLTLASIVEKESPPDDLYEIAGVFWNRIQRRMRLESDATVNYALGTSNLQPTFADTLVDHPYNTYRFVGLPPGPIGNPGVASIRAAAEPAEHGYLFFLHKPTLETVFSYNFSQHLAAKARYLD